jgi:transcriptional/translational regulatory protein YebC/TACO1
VQLYCPPEHVAQLADAVSVHPSVEIQERKIIYVAENPSDSPLGEEVQEKLTRLLDTLWADEDTLNIWTTADKL